MFPNNGRLPAYERSDTRKEFKSREFVVDSSNEEESEPEEHNMERQSTAPACESRNLVRTPGGGGGGRLRLLNNTLGAHTSAGLETDHEEPDDDEDTLDEERGSDKIPQEGDQWSRNSETGSEDESSCEKSSEAAESTGLSFGVLRNIPTTHVLDWRVRGRFLEYQTVFSRAEPQWTRADICPAAGLPRQLEALLKSRPLEAFKYDAVLKYSGRGDITEINFKAKVFSAACRDYRTITFFVGAAGTGPGQRCIKISGRDLDLSWKDAVAQYWRERRYLLCTADAVKRIDALKVRPGQGWTQERKNFVSGGDWRDKIIEEEDDEEEEANDMSTSKQIIIDLELDAEP